MKRAWMVVMAVAMATAVACASSGPETVESLGGSEPSDATAMSDPASSDTAPSDTDGVTVPDGSTEGPTSSVAPADSEPTTTEGEVVGPIPPLMTTSTPWTPPPRIDCGTFDLASGWPTTTAPSRSAA